MPSSGQTERCTKKWRNFNYYITKRKQFKQRKTINGNRGEKQLNSKKKTRSNKIYIKKEKINEKNKINNLITRKRLEEKGYFSKEEEG